jgi:hypothetical protein
VTRVCKLLLDLRDERACFFNAEDRPKSGNEPGIYDNMLPADFIERNRVGAHTSILSTVNPVRLARTKLYFGKWPTSCETNII